MMKNKERQLEANDSRLSCFFLSTIQITVSGFKCISDACRSLSEIVINDMPTLSDECLSVSWTISDDELLSFKIPLLTCLEGDGGDLAE